MARLRQFYVQVLIAMAFGIALGLWAPATAVEMKPLGDAFIALLRMLLGPIIFCSVVLGLTHGRATGLGLLFGVDRLMAARTALTNVMGDKLDADRGERALMAAGADGAMTPLATSGTLKAAGA